MLHLTGRALFCAVLVELFVERSRYAAEIRSHSPLIRDDSLKDNSPTSPLFGYDN
ncbi:MAG: hypothetical protein ACI9MF_001903, partial [Gammaproteobacteria bacterium]